MVLPVSVDATWNNNATVSYNAQELRRADASMFNGDGTAFGVLGGIVRHGDSSLAVTVNASDVVTVQAGAVVIPGNSGVGNGVYRCALGAADTGTLTARNATLPRIDTVIFRALDTDVVAGHGAYTGRVEILTGTPAASPVAPALPVMAVELARISVPISGGAAATVDNSFRTFATSLGGVLPVATAARLPVTETKWDRAVAIDTGVTYVWNGTLWVEQTVTGVRSSADLTLSGAFQAVPGLTFTKNIGANSSAILTASFDVDFNPTGFFQGAPFVDGVQFGTALAIANPSGVSRHMVTQQWVLTGLASGSRVITLRALGPVGAIVRATHSGASLDVRP